MMKERMFQQQPQLTDLPVGFESFHPQKFINYQLNRGHALGYAHRRVFTEEEQADSHCKMGNLDLACGVVTTWLREGRLESTGADVSTSPRGQFHG